MQKYSTIIVIVTETEIKGRTAGSLFVMPEKKSEIIRRH